MENKRSIGAHKEEEALHYLEIHGVRNLHQNFRCHFGEIDLIGWDGKDLVFFEVKYRKNNAFGNPADAVNVSKQVKICKVADFYRVRNKISSSVQIRFDVIAITPDGLTWYKNAFPYVGNGF